MPLRTQPGGGETSPWPLLLREITGGGRGSAIYTLVDPAGADDDPPAASAVVVSTNGTTEVVSIEFGPPSSGLGARLLAQLADALRKGNTRQVVARAAPDDLETITALRRAGFRVVVGEREPTAPVSLVYDL